MKEFRQDYSLFRGQINSEQATWQNKAGAEIHKVNDSVRLVEERVARLTLNPLTWKIWRAPNNASQWQMGFNSAFKGLIENKVTEIQAAAQNSNQKVNTYITWLGSSMLPGS